MAIKKHPYIDSPVKKTGTIELKNGAIKLSIYETPKKDFKVIRISSSKKILQKTPPSKGSVWWMDPGRQMIEDHDLPYSVVLPQDVYRSRKKKGIPGYYAATPELASILDHYSMLPDRLDYNAVDFFIAKPKSKKRGSR